MMVVAAVWEYFTTIALVALAAWLIAAAGMPRARLIQRLASLDRWTLFLLVLIIALALRWLMLLQDSSFITAGGAEEMAMRGNMLVEGMVPYQDFPVRKPPMYLYLGGGIAAGFGESILGVRLVLGAFDALVAATLVLLGSRRASPVTGAYAGLMYATFPVGVFSAGLAGHYDGVVVLFVVLGLLLHNRGSWWWSMALLGTGFALKLYPAVLVPWLLWQRDGWRCRVGGSVVFLLPMALSWVPMLLLNPSALGQYISWQSSWMPVKSISYGIGQLAGWERASDPAVAMGQLVTSVFLVLLVIMFLDWTRRRHSAPDDHARDWFRVVAGSYYVLYIMIIAGSVVEYGLAPDGWSPRTMGIVVAVVCIGLGAWPLWYLVKRFMEPWPSLREGDRDLVVMAFSVMLLLLSSTQNNPWYLIWMVSLVLLMREERLRGALLAMSVWNVEDSGIRLWPGTRFTGSSP